MIDHAQRIRARLEFIAIEIKLVLASAHRPSLLQRARCSAKAIPNRVIDKIIVRTLTRGWARLRQHVLTVDVSRPEDEKVVRIEFVAVSRPVTPQLNDGRVMQH